MWFIIRITPSWSIIINTSDPRNDGFYRKKNETVVRKSIHRTFESNILDISPMSTISVLKFYYQRSNYTFKWEHGHPF